MSTTSDPYNMDEFDILNSGGGDSQLAGKSQSTSSRGSAPVKLDDPTMEEYNKMIMELNKQTMQDHKNYQNEIQRRINANPEMQYNLDNGKMVSPIYNNGEAESPYGGTPYMKLIMSPEKPGQMIKPEKVQYGTETWGESQMTRETKNRPGYGNDRLRKIVLGTVSTEDPNKIENAKDYKHNFTNEIADNNISNADTDLNALQGSEPERQRLKFAGTDVHMKQYVKLTLDKLANMGYRRNNSQPISKDEYIEFLEKDMGIKIKRNGNQIDEADYELLRGEVDKIINTAKDLLQQDKNGKWRFGYTIKPNDRRQGEATSKAPYTERRTLSNGDIEGKFKVLYKYRDTTDGSEKKGSISLNSRWTDGKYVGRQISTEANWTNEDDIKRAIRMANGFASDADVNIDIEIVPPEDDSKKISTPMQYLFNRATTTQKMLDKSNREGFAPEQISEGYGILSAIATRYLFGLMRGK